MSLADRILRAAFAVALAATPALAQELELRGPEPSQIPQGGRALIELRWDLAGGEDVKLLEPPRVRGLALDVTGPSRFESQQYVNGRVTTERRLTWQVTVSAQVLGKHDIPPFRVKVGNDVFRSAPTSVTVVEDLQAKDAAWLELEAPTRAHYVGETVDVALRFGIDESAVPFLLQGDMRRNIVGAYLHVPWIDGGGFAATEKPPELADDFGVYLEGGNRLERCRQLGSKERDGRRYRVYELRRRMRLTRPGRHELEAPTLTFEYATDVRRGPFGEAQVVAKARAFVRAAAATLAVEALPEEGRPADFGNAVGRFTLHADVDRRELELGESLVLTLRVEGEGGFEHLGLPELDDLPGFHRYSRDVERAADHAVVTCELAPVDPEVRELPAISLPYFDPATGRYERAGTTAIPLTVRRKAGAVDIEALPEPDRGVQPGVDDIHDRLPLEGRPLAPFRPGLGLVALVQAVPLLVVLGVGLLLRRHRRLAGDLLGRRARRAMARFAERLPADGALRAFSLFVAERLGWGDGEAVGPGVEARLTAAGLSPATAASATALLDRLQASRYGSAADEGPLADEATAMARAIDEELRR
ncbi:MAG: BatD family protein [Planctomycetota bacterium]